MDPAELGSKLHAIGHAVTAVAPTTAVSAPVKASAVPSWVIAILNDAPGVIAELQALLTSFGVPTGPKS